MEIPQIDGKALLKMAGVLVLVIGILQYFGGLLVESSGQVDLMGLATIGILFFVFSIGIAIITANTSLPTPDWAEHTDKWSNALWRNGYPVTPLFNFVSENFSLFDTTPACHEYWVLQMSEDYSDVGTILTSNSSWSGQFGSSLSAWAISGSAAKTACSGTTITAPTRTVHLALVVLFAPLMEDFGCGFVSGGFTTTRNNTIRSYPIPPQSFVSFFWHFVSRDKAIDLVWNNHLLWHLSGVHTSPNYSLMPEPTVRQRIEIPKDEIKQEPDEKLTVYEWYCLNCEEWIGWPDLDDSPAVICDEATECPHSVGWDGDACGYVICEWCHEPASDRTMTYEQSSL